MNDFLGLFLSVVAVIFGLGLIGLAICMFGAVADVSIQERDRRKRAVRDDIERQTRRTKWTSIR